MRRIVLAVAATTLGTWACSKVTLRAFDGIACSTDPDEDPQRVCSPSQDLVCITTYTVTVRNSQEAPKFPNGRQVYVCRLACDPATGCILSGDVCCPGRIHGRTYGLMHGCVPPEFCDSMDAGTADVRPPADSAPRPDAPPDAAPDAASPDGVPDAPASAVPDADVSADDAGATG